MNDMTGKTGATESTEKKEMVEGGTTTPTSKHQYDPAPKGEYYGPPKKKRERIIVSLRDTPYDLHNGLVIDVIEDATTQLLKQMDPKLADVLKDGMLLGAEYKTPFIARDGDEEAANEEYNGRILMANVANFMVAAGAGIEVLLGAMETSLKRLEEIKSFVAMDEDPNEQTGARAVTGHIAELKTCEACKPGVSFLNCQIGTVVNGDYHTTTGGGVQNFGTDAEEDERFDEDDDFEECDDCACAGSGCMMSHCPAEEDGMECEHRERYSTPNWKRDACNCDACTGECSGDKDPTLETIINALRDEATSAETILNTVKDILKIYDVTHQTDIPGEGDNA